jgi:hypothetical protein
MTPMGRIDSRLSTTGISPQSQRVIMRATSCRGVSGVQQAGLLVMISRTCMLIPHSISTRTGSDEEWDDAPPKK